jgi:hypothetical protein
MGEMIFAFECKADDSWEDAFRSGEHDIVWIPVDKDGNEVPKGEHKYYQMGHGSKDTYKCDYEGMKEVQKRIDNGFRLFGKYYQALWDRTWVSLHLLPWRLNFLLRPLITRYLKIALVMITMNSGGNNIPGTH